MMKNGRRKFAFGHGRRRSLAVTTCALALLAGGIAQAQTAPQPPPNIQTDANSVDLATGLPTFSITPIVLGSGPGTIAHTRTVTGSIYWFHNYTVVITGTAGGNVTVQVGGNVYPFSYNATSGTYVDGTGGGRTLTDSSNFTFTDRDGTVISFLPAYATPLIPIPPTTSATDVSLYNPNGQYIAYGSTITQPNGTVIKLNYTTGVVHSIVGKVTNYYSFLRLLSVSNSAGLTLRFGYATNTLSLTSEIPWSIISSVTGVDTAVDYCNPTGSCNTFTKSWPVATYATTTSGSNYIQTITDPAGVVETVTSSGQAVGSIQIGSNPANVTTFGYDSNGRVSSLSRNGVSYTYNFSLAGSTLTGTLTGPLGTIYTTTADANTGNVLTYKDGLSNTTTYAEDSYGRISQVTHPEGDYESYTYDARGNVAKLTKVPKPASTLAHIVLNAGYDATCANAVKCNQPNWTQDGLGNETDYTYDPTSGLLTSVTRPAAATGGIRPQTRFTYTQLQGYYLNSAGSIVASGVNTNLLTGTSVCRTQAGATITGTPGVGPFTLTGTAACAGTSDETKTTTSYGPQVAGTANNLWPVSQTAAAGDGSVTATTSQTYDSFGNVATATGPLGAGQVTYNFYDPDRHLTGSIAPDPDGAGARTPTAAEYTYNADGALTKISTGTVPNQATTLAGYVESYNTNSTLDTFDRPIRTNVVSGSTTYAVTDQLYDTLGRAWCSIQYMNMAAVPGTIATTNCAPSQTTGPYGPDRISQVTFDKDNRVLTQADSISTQATATYSPDGYVSSLLDANNNLTSYTLDGFNRLSQTNFPLPTKGSDASNPSDYEAYTNYDANNNVGTRRLRDGNTIAFTYDNLARLATRTPGGTSPISSNDYPVSYSYDLTNALKQVVRSTDGQTISLGYDPLGRLTSETQPYGAVTYLVDAAGDRTQISWSDGFYATYAYDMIQGVTSITANGATSGVGVLATYSYDNLGRRTSVAYGNGTSQTYAFDPVSRLAGTQLSFPNTANNDLIGGVAGSGTPIGYSPSSQIASITRSNDAYAWTGAANASRAYTTNGLNQYTSVAGTNLAYDARGNLNSSAPASGGTTTYTYTKLNELVSVPGTATLIYDPLSRLNEYDTSASTRFYYSGGTPVAEVSNPSDTVTQRYVPGPGTDEIVAWYSGTGNTTAPQFLQTDERGSVIAVTSSTGTLVAANSYDEFGVPASTNVGRFGYTGQTWFPEVGLYNYKARWYSPSLGRFMQTDPAGYRYGNNLYNYAGSDPLNGSDPTGHVTIRNGFIIGGTDPGNSINSDIGGGGGGDGAATMQVSIDPVSGVISATTSDGNILTLVQNADETLSGLLNSQAVSYNPNDIVVEGTNPQSRQLNPTEIDFYESYGMPYNVLNGVTLHLGIPSIIKALARIQGKTVYGWTPNSTNIYLYSIADALSSPDQAGLIGHELTHAVDFYNSMLGSLNYPLNSYSYEQRGYNAQDYITRTFCQHTNCGW